MENRMRSGSLIAGAILAGALLIGCGSSDGDSDAAPAASGSNDAMSAAPSTGSTVQARLAKAKVDCGDQQLVGDVECTYKGEQVTVTTDAWAASESERRQACTGGYINKGYVAATGDGLTVLADYNETTQALARRLDLDVVKYCP